MLRINRSVLSKLEQQLKNVMKFKVLKRSNETRNKGARSETLKGGRGAQKGKSQKYLSKNALIFFDTVHKRCKLPRVLTGSWAELRKLRL